MSTIKLTFDDGSGTACIDADWIIGRHQYDGRTLVVYGYDTTLWVSESVEEIDGMLRDVADCDECVGRVYDHSGDASPYLGMNSAYSDWLDRNGFPDFATRDYEMTLREREG